MDFLTKELNSELIVLKIHRKSRKKSYDYNFFTYAIRKKRTFLVAKEIFRVRGTLIVISTSLFSRKKAGYPKGWGWGGSITMAQQNNLNKRFIELPLALVALTIHTNGLFRFF